MQINSMNALYSSTSALASSIAAAAKASETQNISATSNQEKPAPMYDLHHMSLNELKDMIHQMYTDGSLSADDTMRLGTRQAILEGASGYSKDEKIDVLSVLQNELDVMKTQPQSTGIDYEQRTLDLFKGIDARMRATIPSFA